MAIYFNAPTEPLAGPPGYDGLSQKPVLAITQAGKRLLGILERYCNREIAGRSLLVAGHRGAGKTTLVRDAIQDLRGRPYLRGSVIPLYVQIHGPDLLGGATVLGVQSTATAANSQPPSNGDKPGNSAAGNSPSVKPDSLATGNEDTRQKDQDESIRHSPHCAF